MPIGPPPLYFKNFFTGPHVIRQATNLGREGTNATRPPPCFFHPRYKRTSRQLFDRTPQRVLRLLFSISRTRRTYIRSLVAHTHTHGHKWMCESTTPHHEMDDACYLLTWFNIHTISCNVLYVG